MRADVLFKNLKAKRESFAVVIDEHGGMEGVVTITDILECIVGDFDEDTLSENDGDPDILPLEDGRFQIVGAASIDEVNEAVGLELDDEDYDTFGGYVLSLLGAIPEDDTQFTVEDDDVTVEVTSVKEHRIERTIVTKKQREEEEQTEE